MVWHLHIKDQVDFYPMVYGIPGLGHHANTSFPDVPDQYNTILGYNEPNQADQSNIPPEEAAAAWIELQEKYPNKELVAPATGEGDTFDILSIQDSGHADTEWFDAFMAECEILGCRLDYLATHYYTPNSVEEMMTTLKDYSDRQVCV